MDKLQPQTVYVPVAVKERLPKGHAWRFVIDKDNEPALRFHPALSPDYTHWLEKQEGVYPLTGKELWDFFQEYIHSDLPPHEFLKQKGIEI